MQVETVLKRSDLVWFHAYFLPRARTTWIFFLVFSVLALVVMVFLGNPEGGQGAGPMLGTALVAGLAGTLVMYLWCVTMIAVLASEKDGVLGKHSYTLSESGIFERTAVNETFHNWSGISQVNRLPGYLFIRLNHYLFHLIPVRAFDSEAQAERFWNEVEALWARSQSSRND